MRGKKMRGKIASPSIQSGAVIPFDDSPPSYFINIKIPAKPKIRIKIPKLLSKTVQKGFHSTIDHDHSHNQDHKRKRRKTRRLFAFRKVGTIFNNVMKKVGFGHEEVESSEDGSGRDKGASAAANDSVATSVVVIRRQGGKGKFVSVSKKRVLQKREAPGMGMLRSLRKIGSKRFDLKCLNQEKQGIELCKKRILMGGKCKPLSISGALHYDKNGILLPEELP